MLIFFQESSTHRRYSWDNVTWEWWLQSLGPLQPTGRCLLTSSTSIIDLMSLFSSLYLSFLSLSEWNKDIMRPRLCVNLKVKHNRSARVMECGSQSWNDRVPFGYLPIYFLRKNEKGGRESVVVCLPTKERPCFSYWIVSFEGQSDAVFHNKITHLHYNRLTIMKNYRSRENQDWPVDCYFFQVNLSVTVRFIQWLAAFN